MILRQYTSSSSLAASGILESCVEEDVGSLGGGVMERLFPPFSRKRRLSSSGVIPAMYGETLFLPMNHFKIMDYSYMYNQRENYYSKKGTGVSGVKINIKRI